MSATIYVSSDRSGSHALSYANSASRKPHHRAKDLDKRVLKSGYVGCDENTYRKAFSQTWKKAETKKRGLIETYTIRQSFDPKYSYSSPEDIEKVNKMGVELAKRLYPGHLAVVATQADGKGHKLHNHIVVCNPSTLTGRCIRGRAKSFSWVSAQNDRVLSDFGDKPLDTPIFGKDKHVKSPEKIDLKAIEQARPYVYKTDRVAPKGTMRLARLTPREKIKKQISYVIQKEKVTSFDEYRLALKARGIKVIYRYTKKGELRKRISYQLLNSQAKHAFSSRSLGENYERDNLQQLFEQNRQYSKERYDGLFEGFRSVSQSYQGSNFNRSKRSDDFKPVKLERKHPYYQRKPKPVVKPDRGFGRESDEARRKRRAEYKRRVEAIRKYQKRIAADQRKKQNITTSRSKDWLADWWRAILSDSLLDDLRKIFEEPSYQSRPSRVHQSPAPSQKSAEPRDENDDRTITRREIEDDDPFND